MCHKLCWWGRRLVWLNKELLMNFWEKKIVYVKWKKGQETQEEYKEVASICRKKIRENQGESPSLLDEMGNVATKYKEKAKILNAFFISALLVRAVILRVLSLPAWKSRTRSRINLS